MRPAVWAGCESNDVEMELTGITVKKLVDNVNVYLPSTFEVGAGSTSYMALSPSHSDSATPVATLRTVSLNAGSVLIATTAGDAAKLAVESVVAAGPATLAADGNGSIRLGGAFRMGSADAKLTVTGAASFDDETFNVMIPQALSEARKQTEVLDLSGAHIASLPSVLRVFTDSGKEVTARARPEFSRGKLVLYPTRGLLLLVR